jgi:hypothetical protein
MEYDGKYAGIGSDYVHSFNDFRKQLDECLVRVFRIAANYKNQLLERAFQYIRNGLDDVKQSFINIGYYLFKIQSERLYDTSQDFYGYIDGLFGLGKTTIKNMIGLCTRFYVPAAGGYAPKLQDKFKDYSYSQLVELLPLDTADMKKLNPGMTIVQIRDYKAKLKEAALNKAERLTIAAPEKVKTETSEALAVVEKVCEGKSFKNEEERKAFLNTYATWALWVDVPALNLKVRRVSFSNGDVLLAYAYMYKMNHFHDEDTVEKGVKYKWFESGKEIHFTSYFTETYEIVDNIRLGKLKALV